MKTAMEKKETGLMRQIGYLSFVVVLLYGLTLFAVSCDNDEDPPLPPAVEKVVLAFGVIQSLTKNQYTKSILFAYIHDSNLLKINHIKIQHWT